MALSAGSKVLVCMRAETTPDQMIDAKTFLSKHFPDVEWFFTADVEQLAVMPPNPSDDDGFIRALEAMKAAQAGDR